MGKAQRRKGQRFELEIATWLNERLGTGIKRNLLQVREGGADLQLGRLRIECKRRARSPLYAWLRQAATACPAHDLPVIVTRADREVEPLAILRLVDLLVLLDLLSLPEATAGIANRTEKDGVYRTAPRPVMVY